MKYRVMRQDDNGHIAEVEPICATREEAEQLKEKLKRGHHKQMYWIVQLGQDTKDGGANLSPK